MKTAWLFVFFILLDRSIDHCIATSEIVQNGCILRHSVWNTMMVMVVFGGSSLFGAKKRKSCMRMI